MAKKSTRKTKKTRGKSTVSYPEYLQQQRKSQVRNIRKTVFFSEQEMGMIDRYCQKYKVRSRSAFFRELILSHLMQDLDENYPKLFWWDSLSNEGCFFIHGLKFLNFVISLCGSILCDFLLGEVKKTQKKFQKNLEVDKKPHIFAVPFGNEVVNTLWEASWLKWWRTSTTSTDRSNNRRFGVFSR